MQLPEGSRVPTYGVCSGFLPDIVIIVLGRQVRMLPYFQKSSRPLCLHGSVKISF